MRIAVFVFGILLVLLGLLWIGQGTGYFPYPSYSFMISDMGWAWRGVGVARQPPAHWHASLNRAESRQPAGPLEG
jgi:hypothetical protein